jgi:UDP-glucose 4-epimerase
MRVLVTGGAGYIGSVVSEQLVKDGHQVVVYDNLVKGHRGAVVAGAEFVNGDLLDADGLRQTLKDNQVEAVIHMAAYSLVGESVQEPAKYYHNNLVASLALLDAMRECDVKKIVFSSTAAVYGEPEAHPILESAPTNPTNPYGESKLAVERAMEWYREAYELRSVSLRYFNAAGATEQCGEGHDPESHLIPITLQVAAGKRKVVEIFGQDYPTADGTCVRDYIHVIDLARAHILALDDLRVVDDCDAVSGYTAIYNLGCGGNGYSVRDVIEKAREVTGKKIPVHVGPRREGDPAVLIASSDEIKSQLGWQPQFQDLGLIIESAWKWMLAHPNGYGG